MPRRVVNDSDEEEELEALEEIKGENDDGQTAASEAPPVKEHDDRTQSTGSTERMLRHAHALMMDSVTPDGGRSATPISPDVSRQLQTPSASKLKRSRTADATSVEDHSKHKRSKKESRRDDWDVPLSSSPAKPFEATTHKLECEIGHPRVIVTQPGSTIMDSTSSNERRSRELKQTQTSDIHGGEETTTLNSLHSHKPRTQASSASAAANEDKRRRRGVSPDRDDEDADELAIGLPKDHYQPRPSRSRSHNAIEPVTEEVGIESSRDEQKTVVVLDDEHCDQLMDMGFDRSQAERALKETNGNVHHATDWLLSGMDGDNKENAEEVKVQPPRKKKAEKTRGRGRPKKQIVSEDTVDDEASDTKLEQRSVEPELQEDKAEAVRDEVNIDDETKAERREQPEPPADEAGRSKKRGRGRPRKQDFPAQGETADEQQEDSARESITGRQQLQDDVPFKSENDRSVETPAEERTAEPDETKSATTASAEQGRRQSGPREDRTDEQRSPATGPVTKISPIKSGNVPLRVGLSKRMRIPSLLKSARKPAG